MRKIIVTSLLGRISRLALAIYCFYAISLALFNYPTLVDNYLESGMDANLIGRSLGVFFLLGLSFWAIMDCLKK